MPSLAELYPHLFGGVGPPPRQQNKPGLATSFKGALGAHATGLGRMWEDEGVPYGADIRRYGEDVQYRNPSAVTNFEQFAESPWLGVKEAVGSGLGSTLPALIPYLGPIGRTLGAGGAAMTGAAISAVPAYGGIRATQDQTGETDINAARLGALATGGIEQLGGVQSLLRPAGRMIAGMPQSTVRQFTGSTPFQTGLHTAGRVALGEGGEEILQGPIQQYAGGQDPREHVGETAFGGLQGFIGGLIPFGAGAGVRRGFQHSAAQDYVQQNPMDLDTFALQQQFGELNQQQYEQSVADLIRMRIAEGLQGNQPVNLLQPHDITALDQLGADNGELFNQVINPYDVGGQVTAFQQGQETDPYEQQLGLFGGGGASAYQPPQQYSENYEPMQPGPQMQAFPHQGQVMPAGMQVEPEVNRAASIMQAAVGGANVLPADRQWAEDTLKRVLSAKQLGDFLAQLQQPTQTRSATPGQPRAPKQSKAQAAAPAVAASPFEAAYKEAGGIYSPAQKALVAAKTPEEALAVVRDVLENKTPSQKVMKALEEVHKKLSGQTMTQYLRDKEAQEKAAGKIDPKAPGPVTVTKGPQNVPTEKAAAGQSAPGQVQGQKAAVPVQEKVTDATYAVGITTAAGKPTEVTIRAASPKEAVAKAKTAGYSTTGEARPVEFISESQYVDSKEPTNETLPKVQLPAPAGKVPAKVEEKPNVVRQAAPAGVSEKAAGVNKEVPAQAPAQGASAGRKDAAGEAKQVKPRFEEPIDAQNFVLQKLAEKVGMQKARIFQLYMGWGGEVPVKSFAEIAERLDPTGKKFSRQNAQQHYKDVVRDGGAVEQVMAEHGMTLEDFRERETPDETLPGAPAAPKSSLDIKPEDTAAAGITDSEAEEGSEGRQPNTGFTTGPISKVNSPNVTGRGHINPATGKASVSFEPDLEGQANEAAERVEKAIQEGDTDGLAIEEWNGAVHVDRAQGGKMVSWEKLGETEQGAKTQAAWLSIFRESANIESDTKRNAFRRRRLLGMLKEKYYIRSTTLEEANEGYNDLVPAEFSKSRQFMKAMTRRFADGYGPIIKERLGGVYTFVRQKGQNADAAVIKLEEDGKFYMLVERNIWNGEDAALRDHPELVERIYHHELEHVIDDVSKLWGDFSADPELAPDQMKRAVWSPKFGKLQRGGHVFEEIREAMRGNWVQAMFAYPMSREYREGDRAFTLADFQKELFAQVMSAFHTPSLRYKLSQHLPLTYEFAEATHEKILDALDARGQTPDGQGRGRGEGTRLEAPGQVRGKSAGVNARADGVSQEHRAFHGTPHEVDKFTTQKIGTGEGAQAFGWGMYFAGNKAVAEWYREKLTGGSGGAKQWQLDFKGVPHELAAQLSKHINSFINLQASLGQVGPSSSGVQVKNVVLEGLDFRGDKRLIAPDELIRLMEQVRALPDDAFAVKPRSRVGRVYEVELAPNEEDYLQWDRPVSSDILGDGKFALKPEIAARIEQDLKDRGVLEELQDKNHADFRAWSGQELYRSLVAAEREGLFLGPPNATTAEEGVSKYLLSLGVPGIKYLQGASRGKNDGVHNFVIFDDSLVKIEAYESRGAAATARALDASQSLEEALARYPSEVRPAMGAVNDALRNLSVNATNWAKKGLQGVVFSSDLSDIAVKEGLPSAKGFFDLINAKSAKRIKLEAELDRIMTQAADLPDRTAVNKFLQNSTRSERWGYKPSWKPDVEVDDVMAASYRALSPEGRKVVDEVFKFGDDTYAETQKLVNKEINDEFDRRAAAGEDVTEARAKALKTSGRHLPKLQGPYAPLKRFGDYVAVGKSQAYIDAEKNSDKAELERLQDDEKHYFVEFHETLAGAKARARKLQPFYAKAEGFEKQKAYRDVQEVPWGAIAKVKAHVEDLPGTVKHKAALSHLLNDIYLQLLSESSARKVEMKRRGVHGEDHDMLRSFASQGRASAHFIAALENNGPIQKQITSMQHETRDGDSGTREDRSRVFNEIMARYAQGIDWRPTPFTDKAMRMTAWWMLLSTPSYIMQNATQPFMLTLPVLSGRFGNGAAWATMTKAYKDVWRLVRESGHTLDIDKLPVSDDERAMLRHMRDTGRIDLTIAQDLGRWTEKESVFDKGTFGKVMRTIGGLPHKVEMLNRVTSALAAYRLSRGNAEYAARIVDQTHGNYAASNAPRFMHANAAARLITQFRKFQLIQLSLLARLAKDAVKGATPEEKRVARAALTFTLAHHMVMAGALGLPVMNILGPILAHAFGDDDEPKDFERMVRKAIGDEDISNLLLKGVPAAMGVDVSGRIGMGNTTALLPYTDIDLTSKKGLGETMLGASGPFAGGVLPNIADGMGYIARGDLYKGFETMLPRGVRDAMRAYRFATEGVSQRNNDVVLKPSEISMLDTMTQALGLPSTELQARQRRVGDVIETEQYYKARTADIKHKYTKAYRDNDTEEMAELREEWGQVRDAMKKNGLKPSPLSDLLKAPRDQVKREKETVGGVPVRKSNREFVRQGADL